MFRVARTRAQEERERERCSRCRKDAARARHPLSCALARLRSSDRHSRRTAVGCTIRAPPPPPLLWESHARIGAHMRRPLARCTERRRRAWQLRNRSGAEWSAGACARSLPLIYHWHYLAHALLARSLALQRRRRKEVRLLACSVRVQEERAGGRLSCARAKSRSLEWSRERLYARAKVASDAIASERPTRNVCGARKQSQASN